MSKVIKASQVTGEYKIDHKLKVLSLDENKDFESGEKRSDSKSKANSKKVRSKKNKAEEKSAKIIKEAEEKAAEITAQAEAKKEEITAEKDKIYAEIKAEAEAEGLKEAEAEIDNLKKELAETINNFEAEFSREKDRIRKDIIELAVKIASLVIDVKLETEHDLINNIVADMLSKIDDNHRDIVVKVNNELIPYIEENRFYEQLSQKNIEFISDSELKKGDCVVETNLGGKEGSLEHKLDLIKTELLKEVEQHG